MHLIWNMSEIYRKWVFLMDLEFYEVLRIVLKCSVPTLRKAIKNNTLKNGIIVKYRIKTMYNYE